MGQTKLGGAALLVAGALAATGMGSAPAAHATCASFFGIGNSADCTSNATTIAIAIGTGATAHADGLFGTAFAVGYGAHALIVGGGFMNGGGFFNSATAVGTSTFATTAGLFSLAMATGDNTGVNAGVGSSPITGKTQIGNVTIALRGPGSPLGISQTDGIGNVALLIGQDKTVQARGVANTAFSFLGTGSDAEAIGYLNNATNLFTSKTSTASYDSSPPHTAVASVAFTLFGQLNTVAAGPGPFALAGSILQNGQTITKVGPGFNINGIRVGGAGAVPPTRASAATAAAPNRSAAKASVRSRTSADR